MWLYLEKIKYMRSNYFIGNRLWMFLFASLFFVSLSAQQLPENFESWIEAGRQDWEIPGMAVGIVKDGKVVYAQGFGNKLLGGTDKVDANTIFSIASVSKNITSAALGILVDEGKITWEDKIVQHIPWFQFKDAWITNEVSIKDALTHRVGLGRILGNRLQFMTASSRDEVLYQMRYMDFEKPFRTSFVYNNVMYSLAGQIIEYTDGRTWDAFLKERLFEPLEMHSATTSITQLKASDNQAYPHQEINGKIVPISRRNWDNAGPAEGVNASVNDLNKWMLMNLGTPGEYNGKQIVSEKQMNEIHKPQVTRPQAKANGPQNTYGYGWNITDYKGMRVLTHGGATDGFNSAMYLVPELDLGLVVVGNTFNSFGNAIAFQALDAYLGETERDWNTHYLENHKRSYARATAAKEKVDNARHKKTKPSLNLEAYVGKYISKGYGELEVKKVGKSLELHFWNTDGLVATLEHWHYDTFKAVWNNPAQGEEFMQFHLNKTGEVEALDFEFVLRPMLLQVGAYPSNYTHTESFKRK